jgi:hypothetical protein
MSEKLQFNVKRSRVLGVSLEHIPGDRIVVEVMRSDGSGRLYRLPKHHLNVARVAVAAINEARFDVVEMTDQHITFAAPKAKFEIGRVMMTPGINSLGFVPGYWMALIVARHGQHDSGDVCREDAQSNLRDATENLGRVLSAYHIKDGDKRVRVWVITDLHPEDKAQNVTTILLPEEY